jgi:hypothetical protein
LQDACFDSYRARHDAIDAASAQIARVLDIAVDKLNHDVILSAFPRYPQLMRDLRTIRAKIVKSRAVPSDRDAIYDVVEGLTSRLSSSCSMNSNAPSPPCAVSQPVAGASVQL